MYKEGCLYFLRRTRCDDAMMRSIHTIINKFSHHIAFLLIIYNNYNWCAQVRIWRVLVYVYINILPDARGSTQEFVYYIFCAYKIVICYRERVREKDCDKIIRFTKAAYIV